ncbi:MAG: CaiB/BaiF CoA transferase family protein [Deltaproteobacteria bacterium]|jgi:crotonobetainyl-CoA:carnitine CoA-transferase CaiB-like acyl-CoA transferase
MDKPLEGIRVLDLSRLLPGPCATMVLADLGAQVDKVEDPHGGDYLRFMPPHHQGVNAPFRALNRGKRSLVLDLKNPEGRKALLTLLPRYDVLVESFRPGVLGKLGLGFDVMHATHPGLVVCAITGYGQDGPLTHRAGHDINYLARAGVLGLTGPEGGPPQIFGVQLADIAGALFGVQGILAALVARAKSGRGSFVDVSMCEASMPFAMFGLMSAFAGERVAGGLSALAGATAPFGTYATKDGRAMALGALEPKFWLAFCAAVGIEGELNAMVPGPHQAELKAKLRAVFADKTFAEWCAIAAETDCCLEPVLLPEELLEDAQHTARAAIPLEDGLPCLKTPGAKAWALGPAPQQGEHSEAVLREGGLDGAAIAALRACGATR